MKVRIWNEGCEDEVLLRLVNDEDKICLCVVDEDGDFYGAGHILTIDTEDGTIKTCDGLNKNFGFETDYDGRVIIGKS